MRINKLKSLLSIKHRLNLSDKRNNLSSIAKYAKQPNKQPMLTNDELSKYSLLSITESPSKKINLNRTFLIDTNVEFQRQQELANHYYAIGRYADAIKIYESIPHDNSIEVYNALAYCYLGLGESPENSTKAIRYFMGAVKLNDKEALENIKHFSRAKNAEAQYQLSVCYSNGYCCDKNFELAMDFLKLSASQGHAEAEYNIGRCYETGNGCDRDFNKAYEYYNKSLNHNFKEAEFKIGMCYYEGIGVEQDKYKALARLENTAKNGSKRAFKFIKSITESQDADKFFLSKAHCTLGDCYANGYGTGMNTKEATSQYLISLKQNYKDALTHLENLAQQENYAKYNLALCYENGIGTQKDTEKAHQLFIELVQSKYHLVQSSLRQLAPASVEEINQQLSNPTANALLTNLQKTETVKLECLVDALTAKKLVKDEVKTDDNQSTLDTFYNNINRNQADNANSSSITAENNGNVADNAYFNAKLIQALQGNAYSQFLVSNCYANGTGVQQNKELQMVWLNKASESGSRKAKYRLAQIYLNSNDMKNVELGKQYLVELADTNFKNAVNEIRKREEKENDAKIIKALIEQAEKGNVQANYELGHHYMNGYKTRENIDRAVVYLSNASRNGNDKAQYELGIHYVTKTNSPSFKKKGLELLQDSAKQGNTSAKQALSSLDIYNENSAKQTENKAKQEVNTQTTINANEDKNKTEQMQSTLDNFNVKTQQQSANKSINTNERKVNNLKSTSLDDFITKPQENKQNAQQKSEQEMNM